MTAGDSQSGVPAEVRRLGLQGEYVSSCHQRLLRNSYMHRIKHQLAVHDARAGSTVRLLRSLDAAMRGHKSASCLWQVGPFYESWTIPLLLAPIWVLYAPLQVATLCTLHDVLVARKSPVCKPIYCR